MPQSPIDPNHESTRSGLSVAGLLLVCVGGIFTLVGLVDFFSSFADMNRGFPSRFWCAFVGLPMLGIGVKLLFFGNVGRIARYMSQEVTPVSTDTFNYAVGQTKDSIREVAQVVGEGLGLRERADTSQPDRTDHRCGSCGHINDANAKFCAKCGHTMSTQRACPSCQNENDANARFCDQCGAAL